MRPALARFRVLAGRSGRVATEWLDEPDATLLERLRLTDGAYLKRAAALLFHPDPEAFVGGAWIKVGAFGESDADLRFQDEVHGPLLLQVEAVVELLKAKYLKAPISYQGLQRIETLQVPEAALREALLNAVVHKDYASSVPIQISVYPDRLLIWNAGQLPPTWTVEKLLDKHPSIPFNPDVANTFFRAGQIESWGRGIERMVQACRAAGAEPPALRHDATGLWVEFALLSSSDLGGDLRGTPQVTPQVALLAGPGRQGTQPPGLAARPGSQGRAALPPGLPAARPGSRLDRDDPPGHAHQPPSEVPPDRRRSGPSHQRRTLMPSRRPRP